MARRPMVTRRQFLVAGGVFGAWTVLGAPNDPVAAATGEQDDYTLHVGYSERELGPFRLRTRTYNSALPGPLMVPPPDHTLHVTLLNHLPPDPPASGPPGVDASNNPHAFNTTKLHVHGLKVIPHLFEPLGTLDPAAVYVSVGSQQRYEYRFQLPSD